MVDSSRSNVLPIEDPASSAVDSIITSSELRQLQKWRESDSDSYSDSDSDESDLLLGSSLGSQPCDEGRPTQIHVAKDRKGPILQKPLTTSQIIKTRVARFCSRILHCRYDRRHSPTSKQIVTLLALCCLQNLAYCCVIFIPTYVFAFNFAVSFLLYDFIPQLLYPIAGWLGDVYLGRFRAIKISLLVTGVGCLAITIQATVYYMANPVKLGHPSLPFIVLFILSSILLYIGSALFNANMIPYGADLMTFYRSSNEISSYFYWYYWVRNFSGLGTILPLLCLAGISQKLIHVILPVVACCIISAAAVLCIATNHWFMPIPLKNNPYKRSLQILCYALVTRRPTSRAAFGIGKSPPPRIDLAKRRHGGRFSNEEVEDVKTIGRLLLMFLTFGGLFIPYNAVSVNYLISERLSEQE